MLVNPYQFGTQKHRILQKLIDNQWTRVRVNDISTTMKPKILNHTARINEIRQYLNKYHNDIVILNYTRIHHQYKNMKLSRYCLCYTEHEDRLIQLINQTIKDLSL